MNNGINARENCVFGPIPSRRLGLSLGIDLMPYKTCPMDCIYCECGKTTDLTTKRKEYFPLEKALRQIDEGLAANPNIDYITFSGVGEPTLYSKIGDIVKHIHANYPKAKICLLTNSVLLDAPGLAEELAGIDLVIPSLDGSNEEELQKINRPADGCTFERILQAIIHFRKTFRGQMWLEIFVARGCNDTVASAERFRDLVRKIKPDKVQLNTLDRPGTEHGVGLPDHEMLMKMKGIISEAAPVECVGGRFDQKTVEPESDISVYNEKILNMLRSRPCTAADLAQILLCTPDKAEAHMRRLVKAGTVTAEEGPRGTYFRAV